MAGVGSSPPYSSTLYKTNLFYRDNAGSLKSISYGDTEYDINCVQDQGALVQDIIEMELPTPRSVVLCCIERK